MPTLDGSPPADRLRSPPVGTGFAGGRRLYIDDVTGRAGGLEEAADVRAVAGDNVGVQVGGGAGDDGVDDVLGGGAAHQFPGGVGFLVRSGG